MTKAHTTAPDFTKKGKMLNVISFLTATLDYQNCSTDCFWFLNDNKTFKSLNSQI